VLNEQFDPYDTLIEHDQVLNNLINAHNELAKLTENLAATIVKLNARLEQLERHILLTTIK
jgi:ABC-type transporter Mla subunit MlaD